MRRHLVLGPTRSLRKLVVPGDVPSRIGAVAEGGVAVVANSEIARLRLTAAEVTAPVAQLVDREIARGLQSAFHVARV